MNDLLDCEVIDINLLSDSISKIVLRTKNPFVYLPGQYIEVLHKEGRSSPLSIACAPNAENLIELHLSHAPENVMAQDILKMIQQEKHLLIKGPFGKCIPQKFLPDQPIIFLAGGTGFAPVKSLIEGKVSAPLMHLYWVVGEEKDLYLRQLPEQWVREKSNFSFTPVIGRQVSFDRLILQDHADLSEYQVYASGPASLVFAGLEIFQRHGLIREYFYSDMVG